MAREVKVAILGDTRDFSRAVSSANRDADRLGGAFGRVGGHIASFAKTAALGLVGAGAAVGAFSVSAINAASDLGESMSKVQVVFADTADEVVKWSETAATAMGMSQQQALEAAGTFGNFLISMGNPADAAQEMSMGMVQLASDLASFNNANPEDVLLALRAGLSGEAEPLRKFGVSLSAARVEAEGMAVGIKKSYSEMTAAEKSTLSYQIIMKDTALAQGDFARTSDGLANKQRILSARFTDLKAKIGQGLMPIALKLAEVVGDKLFPLFEKLGPVVEEVGRGFSAFAAAFTAADGDVTSSGFPGFMEKLANSARLAFDAVSTFVRDALEKVRAWWDDHGENLIARFSELGAFIVEAFSKVSGFITWFLLPALGKIVGWIVDNEAVFKTFATFIGVTLVGHYVKLGVSATIAGAQMAAAWIAATGPAILFIAAIAGAIYLTDRFLNMVGTTKAISSFINNQLVPLLSFLDKILSRLTGINSVMGNILHVASGLPGGPKEASPERQKELLEKYDTPGTKKAQGGMVPGSLGQPRMILAHGGEQVLTHGQQMRGGGAVAFPSSVTLVIDGQQFTAKVYADGKAQASRRGVAA